MTSLLSSAGWKALLTTRKKKGIYSHLEPASKCVCVCVGEAGSVHSWLYVQTQRPIHCLTVTVISAICVCVCVTYSTKYNTGTDVCSILVLCLQFWLKRESKSVRERERKDNIKVKVSHSDECHTFRYMNFHVAVRL